MTFLLSAIPGIDQTASTQVSGLTTAGWIFVSTAWLVIISVAAFCYRKVIQKSEQNRRATP
ncbi:hypothetical protein HUU05_11555 [candidate division KSB1 bacterium]|nr:hypothetical protein [candidate division KSB1 bacterium]